ncbi:MAG: Type 1 glutamine amidotransferase-like domain-containing protein [Eubacterium sp.]|nr:Type 1 glutamine amidotransferase-like domain-containing protein [Eubacterium sp.]
MNNFAVYILTSGFTNGFTDDFKQQVKKFTDNPQRFVFIASEFNEGYDKTDKYCSEFLEQFSEMGISFTDKYIVDGRVSKEEAREKIAQADVIWITGGHPINQMKYINSYGLPAALQSSKALIIGVSAGAINMAKRVVLPRRNFIPELSVYYGIGLVDINIDPHFDMSDEKHIEEIKEAALLSRIYGLYDDSFITVKDGVAEFYGDYIIFG